MSENLMALGECVADDDVLGSLESVIQGNDEAKRNVDLKAISEVDLDWNHDYGKDRTQRVVLDDHRAVSVVSRLRDAGHVVHLTPRTEAAVRRFKAMGGRRA